MLLDGIASAMPEAIGAGTNLATQVTIGLISGNAYEWFGWDIELDTWAVNETTSYKVITEYMIDHWNTSDWEGLGRDATMIFSSLTKNEPTEFVTEIVPV